MKNRNNISIVIPNWNGEGLLERYLPFVIKAGGNSEVIVADDGSTDNSLGILKTFFPQVKTISSKIHEGFASAVNRGVAQASGDIVVLLNTDTAPESNFLEPLLKHFDDTDIFSVGCLEKSHENGKIVLRGRGLGHWESGLFIHSRGKTDKRDTAWVCGGSGAFRKSIWQELGGMDPLYNPFYWEDIDLSYRAVKAGYKILFEPESVVHHYHNEGKIKQEFPASRVKEISYRNQFIFIWKNLSEPKIFFQHLFWTPICLLRSLINGDYPMIKGFLNAVVMIPKILISRLRGSRFWKISDEEIFIKTPIDP